MVKKDKKIIKESKKTGIPIFVFTAKDKLAFEVLKNYYEACKEAKCKKKHISGIEMRILEWATWMMENKKKLKLPD